LRNRILAAALLSLLTLACAVTGCGGTSQPVDTQTHPSSVHTTAPKSEGAGKTVTMNGRSVMSNWMKHWGSVGSEPVKRDGYTLTYAELDANDIAPSFARNVSGLAPSSVTFFKFCFADFDGSNLATLQKEVEQVIATAKARQLKLIIGNALLVRKAAGSPEMLEEYRKYNAFLAARAAGGDICVYDFYGVLAGDDGFLKPEYQTEDSHPNEKAYRALDRSFFPLLAEVFAGKGQGGGSSQTSPAPLILESRCTTFLPGENLDSLVASRE